jgi:hypothetical protein
MKKKILLFALIVAMLAFPISSSFANKPDKFVSFSFYGGPDFSAGPMITEDRGAGQSDNHFTEWIFIGWKFSWTPTGSQVFALGEYTGKWVHHGYEPGIPFATHTARNINGMFNMVISDWSGEEGYLILKGVENENPGKSSGKLTVLEGMIGDMKVHGTGTATNIVPHIAWRYDLLLQFTP